MTKPPDATGGEMGHTKRSTKAETAVACAAILEKYWAETKARADAGETSDFLTDEATLSAIRYSLNCREKGYHYVLLTQLVAKLDDSARDCRSLQAGAAVAGAFDARSIAHMVVVKFEKSHLDRALGDSPSPYLINSIRVSVLDPNAAESKKDKRAWAAVCQVTLEVENRQNPEFTARVFKQVLLEIYRKLGATEIKYDVPLRASLTQTLNAVRQFTSGKSGGDRPLAVTAALFETIGKYTNLFRPSVRRGRINASDESSGQIADIECLSDEGNVVIAIEVKDKTVTISDLEEKLAATRAKQVKEVFFVSAKGNKQAEDVPLRIAKEFSAGQNIYVLSLAELTESILALTGEPSRRDFMIRVGEQLDKYSDTKHRLAWKKTLDELSKS